MRKIRQSRKLQNVRYDVRGPILVEAQRLEAEGHRILKLNIGNTAPFGFEAPEAIVADIVHHLPDSQGYSDSQGIYPARTAVAQYYQSHGLRDVSVEDVFIGNGVSELISMVLQAFLDDGNEILVPAPDYPLWTGAVTLSGGTAVHYECDEDNDWNPDLADIEAKITENTHGLVIINPNNPTGAVYSEDVVKGLVDIARRHELVVFADEIYEKILFDDAVHHHAATYAGSDVLCLTFSGLSKAYRVCGYRAGWLMISGPKELADGLPRGPDPDRQHADVRQRARAARDPDRAGRLPVRRGADRPRRPLLRAEQARAPAAQRDPRRQQRRAARRALLLPAARPRGLPDRGRRGVRHRAAARQEDPGHPRHRLQLAAARPLPAGDAARRSRARGGHRPDRRLPRDPPLSPRSRHARHHLPADHRHRQDRLPAARAALPDDRHRARPAHRRRAAGLQPHRLRRLRLRRARGQPVGPAGAVHGQARALRPHGSSAR